MDTGRSIGCVVLNHFRAHLELGRRPDLADRPGLIVDRSGSRPLVADSLPPASPVKAGMTLERALALEPEALVLEADEPHYRREFEQILEALGEVSDRVEGSEQDGGLGIAYIGLDGLDRMHGGEAELHDALLAALPEELGPRVGAGPNPFTAYVAARTRRAPGLSLVEGDPARFLAPHPIGLLPLPPDLLEELGMLGLHRLGDVAAQEPEALLDRFGRDGRRAWELASGIDERPLRPRAADERVSETILLPSGANSLELLRLAVDTLVTRVFAQPQVQGRYAATATLTCHLEDAPDWTKAFHFRRPVGDWRRAAGIIKARLETEHPRAPVEAMTITLTGLSGATGAQLSLFPNQRADREQRLLETERGLQARFGGKQALHRLVEAAPWHPAPELRTLQVPIDPAARSGMRPVTAPASVEVREDPGERPSAVRVGGEWRAVTRIENRWSFELWWRPAPIQRSYYRVSAEDGRRLTLYRDGEDQQWYRQSA
ncbi:MAG: hypothetical protein OXT70_12805 [Chloroflexota bacterium]|nr:hypothetical protein [Chloroflexota bacterium]